MWFTGFDISYLLQTIGVFAATITASVGATLSVYKFYEKIKRDHAKEKASTARSFVPVDAHKKSLNNHSIFHTLLRMRSVILTSLDFSSQIRTEVFKNIMIKKIDTWADLLLSQASEIDKRCVKDCKGHCSMTAIDLVRHNKQILEEGFNTYNTYFMSDPAYNDEEREILKYAIKIFNDFHAPAVGSVNGTIDSIITNSQYGYCAKIYQADIFSAYEIGMKMMLNQSTKALATCNGYFNDKEFRVRSYPAPSWKHRI